MTRVYFVCRVSCVIGRAHLRTHERVKRNVIGKVFVFVYVRAFLHVQ